MLMRPKYSTPLPLCTVLSALESIGLYEPRMKSAVNGTPHGFKTRYAKLRDEKYLSPSTFTEKPMWDYPTTVLIIDVSYSFTTFSNPSTKLTYLGYIRLGSISALGSSELYPIEYMWLNLNLKYQVYRC